eukprot:2826511-Rhodomonas_salina.1
MYGHGMVASQNVLLVSFTIYASQISACLKKRRKTRVPGYIVPGHPGTRVPGYPGYPGTPGTRVRVPGYKSIPNFHRLSQKFSDNGRYRVRRYRVGGKVQIPGHHFPARL